MSQILDGEMPDVRSKAEYPWTEWQDGQRRVIYSGFDFAPSAEKFVPQLYNRGRSTDMRVKVRLDSVRGQIEFQFFPGQPYKRAGA